MGVGLLGQLGNSSSASMSSDPPGGWQAIELYIQAGGTFLQAVGFHRCYSYASASVWENTWS